MCHVCDYRMDEPTSISRASDPDHAADEPLQEINGEKKEESID